MDARTAALLLDLLTLLTEVANPHVTPATFHEHVALCRAAILAAATPPAGADARPATPA